jgi:hypothetical protein
LILNLFLISLIFIGRYFGNPDEPPQGAVNMRGNPASATDPGSANPSFVKQFPGAFSLASTEVGEMLAERQPCGSPRPTLFWTPYDSH